jgi:RNA polymerase sigma factor for flagellar operon FliA
MLSESRADGNGAFAAPAAINEEALLLQYLPLVKRAARHLRSQIVPSMALEDLEQIGLLGLLEALRRYGAPDECFAGFAFKRIRGAMLDELRRQDWRPRQLRQQAHNYDRAVRSEFNRRGRAATDQELAQALQISLAEVRELAYASQAEAMQSLDELLETPGWDIGGGNESAALELQLSLRAALAELPAREQRLLALYYQQELNMKEVALVLELTESRVCQLHKQCLAFISQRLRAAL